MRDDWEEKLLTDVIDLKSGTTVSKELEKDVGDIPYLKVSDMNLPENEESITTSSRYLNLNDIKLNKILPVGTVIFPKRGGAISTNKKRLIKTPACVDLNIMGAVPRSNIIPKLLYYYFLSFDLLDISNGSSIPQINNYSFENLKISLPGSIIEQKRIVAILDEAFEAIDQAKANIERNITNAEELFQSKLNEIFSQRGEGWEERNIDEITNVINGYAFKSNNFSPENSVKAIKITNVGVQEFVEDTENNLPKEFLDTYDKVKVARGDIVIALTRTIISNGLKVARVPESYDGALVNQRVAALSPIKELINPTYLYHFLSTDIVSNYVLSNVNTLMQPNLSIRDLRKLKVPICSISKQKEITFKIDSLWDNVSKVIEAYQRELNNISELKKSILQKAFSGELTANEELAA